MDPLAAVDDLRRTAAELLVSEDEGARRVGGRLKFYLENAASGAVLETSLGLMPGEPWWLTEGRKRRDKALRELHQQFYADRRVAQAAYEIERAAQRYAASAWRFDQGREGMPASYAGTINEGLWAAFKSNAPMPLRKRQLQTILAAECNDPPIAIASDAPDDDQTTEGDPHVARTAAKARRTG